MHDWMDEGPWYKRLAALLIYAAIGLGVIIAVFVLLSLDREVSRQWNGVPAAEREIQQLRERVRQLEGR